MIPKLISKNNAFPNKIPAVRFFLEMNKLTLSLYINTRDPEEPKLSLKRRKIWMTHISQFQNLLQNYYNQDSVALA